jgi:hypothetical protein
MSDYDIPEECPHCEEAPPSRQLDAHVASVHADLPSCTAFIETEHRETYRCSFRAGHNGGEYGTWHASKRGADMGRYIWNDTATGALPHQDPEPSDRLDELKRKGFVSHTVVATGGDAPTSKISCCPDGEVQAEPSRTASLSMYSGLVVQPYRNDQGKSCWVFRCWGTDTCDGWLSLDHASEQSAVRALTRHFEEHHASAPAPEVKIRIRGGLTDQQRAEVQRIIADEMRRTGREGGGRR